MFYSSEHALKKNQLAINDFYKDTLNKAYLETTNGQLFYAYAIPNNAKAAIVLSTGRLEGLDKYKELLWELYNNSYAVFISDHQGQGRSYRILKNKHKGYVNQFHDYSADFDFFNKHIVDVNWQGKKVLVSHSMGGAIAFDYLSHYTHTFCGAFLSAPMFDIHTNGIPKSLAKLIAATAVKLGFQYNYALGQTDYSVEEFALNTLTSSDLRYQLFRETYQAEPLLQLGGVTYGWLNATFKFIASMDKLNVTIPVYITSAGNDAVVDNLAQYKLAQRHNLTTIKNIEGAKHELFFERDEIRKLVLKNLYQFCDSLTA